MESLGISGAPIHPWNSHRDLHGIPGIPRDSEKGMLGIPRAPGSCEFLFGIAGAPSGKSHVSRLTLASVVSQSIISDHFGVGKNKGSQILLSNPCGSLGPCVFSFSEALGIATMWIPKRGPMEALGVPRIPKRESKGSWECQWIQKGIIWGTLWIPKRES